MTFLGSSNPFFGDEATKRKVFFSFHYADIMRVNNVRMCGEFKQGGLGDVGESSRRGVEFYDYSLWEKKKLEGRDAVMRLIREGVEGTSAVCVLIGSQTFGREWVRYEIARSVIDQRGLLGVHLNSLRHTQELRADSLGPNPLDYMGVYKVLGNSLASAQYYLAEWVNGQWQRYSNFSQAVAKPRYLPEPNNSAGVVSLSSGAFTYDFVAQQGHEAIGAWIDHAAKAVGR